MYITEVPMYRPDRRRVQLDELLNSLPENSFCWHILELYAVGDLVDITWCEFDKKLQTSSSGIVMTWNELLVFSQRIEYVIDGLIVAVIPGDNVSFEQCWENDYQGFEIALDAQDSTYWKLAASEKTVFDKLVNVASA